jgi:FkbM family methyltransferase
MDYEASLETFYRKLDLRDQFVIDVGAHVGRHAFPLSEMVGGRGAGTVFAFEPLPEIRAEFQRNIGARGVVNIVVFPFALSTEDGVADFTFTPRMPGYSGLKPRNSYDGSQTETVQITVAVRRLDDLVPKRRKVAFMKIDAEGGELGILQGAALMIEDSRPIVAFECGAASFLGYHDSPETIFDLFDALNYAMFSITGVRVEDRATFRRYSHEQKFWDYIAIPSEKAHLGRLLSAEPG